MAVGRLRDGVGSPIEFTAAGASASEATANRAPTTHSKTASGSSTRRGRMVLAARRTLAVAGSIGGKMLRDKDTPMTRLQGVVGIGAGVCAIMAFFVPAFMQAHDNALRMEIALSEQKARMSALESLVQQNETARRQDHDVMVKNAAYTERIFNWLYNSPKGIKETEGK